MADSLFLYTSFYLILFLWVLIWGVLSGARSPEDGEPRGIILSVTLFAVAVNSITGVLPGVHGSSKLMTCQFIFLWRGSL